MSFLASLAEVPEEAEGWGGRSEEQFNIGVRSARAEGKTLEPTDPNNKFEHRSGIRWPGTAFAPHRDTNFRLSSVPKCVCCDAEFYPEDAAWDACGDCLATEIEISLLQDLLS